MDGFGAFWASFPRKVGKLAAQKAYANARKHATADEIRDGLERYLCHLPDERRFIPHARTWLSQGRWSDEYGPVKAEPEDWYDECGRIHDHACGLNQHTHHIRRVLEQARSAKDGQA